MVDAGKTPGTTAPLSLADRFDLAQNRIFVSGPQAIVRLLLMQAEVDRRAGLKTAGFVSGYRGSPLGGVDLNLARAKKQLEARDIRFEPGLNEDLAATAIWGAQQAEMRGEGRFDGVFGLWYGKGPGVDRSGDVLRHVNLAGTSRFGGVLALMGDDHTAESSSTAHQSEFAFVDVMIPILAPAGVQELLDYGLYGYALSRYSGCWVGLKCLKDTVESTASVDAAPDRVQPVVPTDFFLPPDGLNIRARDPVLDQEKRLQNYKRDAVLAWLRANKLNRIVISGGAKPRLGIIAAGKSYLDVRQALDELGIDELRANALGLRVYKIACTWPLEPQGLREFAQGLDKIIVVEEKRSLIENQLRDELYGSAHQPVCVGKKDEKGRTLFPVAGALDVNPIAIAIGRRLLEFNPGPELEARVAHLESLQRGLTSLKDAAVRTPYFCSGCPHNTSTKVPEGMRAYAGIGCHYMVQGMDRATEGYTHMGGEGANWIGEALFSTRGHIVQNLGDGTYNHSGVLAIRWAIAAGTNITFKILFNDAVAMTGGQQLEGGLTVDKIVRQVAAEGAHQIVVVTDDLQKYQNLANWPRDVEVRLRDELDAVQRELAVVAGTTVLVYDQTCAAEKRRRRKRGEFPDPDKRVFINDLVCEGCGDCGKVSNCVSLQPLETEFGRKRVIDQASCNKDFSCLEGFCPAMVTVHGAKLKVAGMKSPEADDFPPLPQPAIPQLGDKPFAILITGVGGTGVVTIGAFLAMAAHLEGKICGSTDMAGLAQKGGAVQSHIKIAARPEQIHAIGIGAGGADLIIGCDLVVSGTAKALAAIRPGETGVVINTAETYPGDFTRDPDFTLPVAAIKQAIQKAAANRAAFCDATSLATALVGTSVAANIFLVGFAWQRGLLPLSEEALMRAIEIVGESVEMNKRAFLWGRREAFAPDRVAALLAPAHDPASSRVISETFAEKFARRQAFLTVYQNRAYAENYAAQVERIAEIERRMAPGEMRLAVAVAKSLFKLMAVKDEYEVARLYSDGTFTRSIAAAFEGDIRITFHLAPPIFARKPGTVRKWAFGPAMMRLFKILRPLKVLRGTPLDFFGWSSERRLERELRADYEKLLDEIAAKLTPENYESAVALAALPEKIRGFGHVKLQSVEVARAEETALLAQFRAENLPQPVKLAAE
ncbi:indolepyruvate ferredoxin oxidoreductase [Methylovirgula ligni]|uniref:Indolepyruvate ferredoxin oxidoreductase n=1 Tax=Methylovirgula ligni TaxID=569860 RepID=A0A3D9Z1I6_9HYPH|nr:indolepyruvate ferredoxin oxidoreductase family protein [Methylovirgula ligni]QAY95653.1 indolepyruvate ferredoxin oxidoreductase [Methylovirgula ligni]REF88987.1 indolepyruvate ferredoxin oxidoreductase [Methylovirgula ligni]